ncbi:caspase family protein [Rhodococcus sp. DMU1]|uniref:caspase family protein n=1 Tax=Rhodococcus sp. DMU1 TaxID=2722825 RepID=UPI00143E9FFF|nr:caspase family protein [Rhodococcus sp. DMU1]QIX53923.1 caspase family protein [Rhodococcus sp. DMU1]
MSTGFALHIGLDNVDPQAYAGWDGALDGAENDATAMAALTGAVGFKRCVLLSSRATSTAVFAALRSAATQLVAGDICVVTYAGHGGQMPTSDSEEADRLDETWLLFDREVLDDEIHQALTAFAAGVRVVVVSDSCHSGTVIREFYRQVLENSAKARASYSDVAARHRAPAARSSARTFAVRAVPAQEQARAVAAQRDRYLRIRQRTPRPADGDVSAAVLLMAACQDNQAAMETDGHGTFTAALLDVWNDGGFTGDYRKFHERIRASMPPTQTPNLLTLGRDLAGFLAQVPLTIASPAGPLGTSSSPQASPLAAPDRVRTFRVEVAIEGDAAAAPEALRTFIAQALRPADG